jgi:Short C-terminal domain/Phospholipase_D-nuclease N-terminal
VLAYDYPLLGAFFSVLWIFLWILWLFLLFRVIMDIFRDDSLSGFVKALWLIFVILLPFLGVFIYVIVRGSEMGKRDLAQAQASEEAFRSYVQQAAASGGGTADELAKLADLRQRGVISDAEFEQQKAKMLA